MNEVSIEKKLDAIVEVTSKITPITAKKKWHKPTIIDADYQETRGSGEPGDDGLGGGS